MISVEMTKEEADAMLRCLNYLYASMIDVKSIENEEERKEAELTFYRAAFAMQNMDKEHEKSMLNKVQEIWKMVADEFESEGVPAQDENGQVSTVPAAT